MSFLGPHCQQLEATWCSDKGLPQMMSGRTWYMYRGSTTDDQIAEIRGPGKMEHSGAPPHAEIYLKAGPLAARAATPARPQLTAAAACEPAELSCSVEPGHAPQLPCTLPSATAEGAPRVQGNTSQHFSRPMPDFSIQGDVRGKSFVIRRQQQMAGEVRGRPACTCPLPHSRPLCAWQAAQLSAMHAALPVCRSGARHSMRHRCWTWCWSC